MLRTGASCVGLVVLAACGGSPDRAPVETPTTMSAPTEPLRVLVTGFNDWKGLGDPPNVWRCRDNPSCRLLVGDPRTDAPTAFEGSLPAALSRASRERPIAWTFETLPVTWEVARGLPGYANHDVVVHLGLGVYDRTDEIFVEAGAYNLRKGADAAGNPMQGPILTDGEGDVVPAPAGTDIAARVEAVNGGTFGAFTARVKPARKDNSYLCNETHTWALEAVKSSQASGGSLRGAYFVHIPYAPNGDFEALAEGVAGVVLALAAEP